MTGSEPRSPERTRSTKARDGAADAGGVLDADVAAIEQRRRCGSDLRIARLTALRFIAHDRSLVYAPCSAWRRPARRDTAFSVAPVMAATSSWFDESG